jgi:hypothetical protein
MMMLGEPEKGAYSMSADTTVARAFRGIALGELGETMLTVFDCSGITKHSATYISTPITTGELLLLWHEGNDTSLSHEELRAKVIHRNLVTVQPLIERVRKTESSAAVVEPVSMIDVPGWTQPDYRAFWCAFIERYANRVVFNEGWHLSNGCAAEFATATLAGHELLDDQLEDLPVEKAIEQVESGFARLEAAGLDTTLLRRTVAAVRHG